MANVGIYREPGVGGGLPLPRARLVALTVIVGLLALTSILMGPGLLVVVGRSLAGAWRLFRDGGGWMWLILLLDLAAPVAIAALGAFILRGRAVPAGLLFGAAALPMAVALLGAWRGQRMTVGAISGESIDPEQKARILAEGIAESMSADIFGGFVTCGVAIVAAAAASFAVASIDLPGASRGGPKPSSAGAIGASAAGALWLVATIGLGFARFREAGGLVLLPVLPVLVLVPLAVLAGRAAPILSGWHDREESRRAAGALLIAALSALLAVLALEHAIDARFLAQALGAISGETIDESQRARVLAQGLEAGRLGPVAYGLQAVLGAATFGLALAPATGWRRSPATPSAAVAAAFGAALLAAAFALSHSRSAAPRVVLTPHTDRSLADVTLPVLVETFSHKGSSPGYGSLLVLDKRGAGAGTVPAGSCGPRWSVYADGAATVAMLRARVGPPSRSCTRPLVFVARREHAKDVDARLGDLAGYLGTQAYVPITMDASSSDEGGRRDAALRAVLVADDAIELDGVRFALPLAKDAAPPPTLGARLTRIDYVFRPTDTIERVVQTIAAVETLYGANLAKWEVERFLDDGARPAQPPPRPPRSAAPGLRAGPVTVNGALPTEVIQRIVRQNFGRFRLCYENGQRTNPDLRGRVSVKFVIDRSGAVSTAADAGSDLAERAVIACIVHAFENLSFPQPEGGVVTVVYPLLFEPPL
jgi:hypothetical protein